MADFSIGAALKTLSAVVGRFLPLARRLRMEQKAGRAPYTVPDDLGEGLLDGALERLGAPLGDDPLWRTVVSAAGASLVRPESFRKPHVQEWLSREDVRATLKRLARAVAVGSKSDEGARKLASDVYSEISGEDRHHAEAMIETAVAFLKASLHGAVDDAGTGALVQTGIQGLHERFDGLHNALSILPSKVLLPVDSQPLLLDIEVVEHAFGAASQTLLDWPQETDGHWIERSELDQLRVLATQEEPSVTVLLSGPGEGKSALLARLGTQLSAQGVVLLAIKADQIPRTVGTLAELDAWVGCEVPVARALRQLASDRHVVLLIDQLDALADLMDQHSERLSALVELVRVVRDTPNFQVILSCRAFEFRNDVRLSSLNAQVVTLTRPTWEQVLPLLLARGVDTDTWNDDARSVLCTPQHLAVFLTHLAAQQSVPAFTSYQALLGHVIRERLEGVYGVRTVEAAEAIATEMAREEELWLGRDRFEAEFGQELKNLLAEEFLILSQTGLTLAFRHQTLFDFLRARAFLRSSISLAEHVIAEKQESLFVRPILWSALHYLRAADQAVYRRELGLLWERDGLRPHLRYLLLSFLGQLNEPDDEEARWLLPALEDAALRGKALRSMVGSPGWFARLSGRLPSLMKMPPEIAWDTVFVLRAALPFARDTVLNLIEQHWLLNTDYITHALRTVDDLQDWDRRSADLARRIVDRSDIAAVYVRGLAERVSRSQPDLMPTVVICHLEAKVRDICANPPAVPDQPPEGAPVEQIAQWHFERDEALYGPFRRLLEDHSDWHDLDKLVVKAPRAFIERAWPWLSDVLERLAYEPETLLNRYRKNHGLSFTRMAGAHDRQPLVRAFEAAVRSFAESEAEAFLRFVEVHKDSELLAQHHLLALGLEQIAASHPEAVLGYLLEDPRRLALGDMHDEHHDSRALISAVVPALGNADVQRLEQTVITWKRYREAPEGEDRKTRFMRRKWMREHRLRLLRSFPIKQLSAGARRHLEQEERALPNASDYDVGPMTVRTVGSPMSALQMELATDDQILALFEELTDETDWSHPKRRWDNRVGGSIQVSREFATFAKSDPERAFGIVERFEAGGQERPAGAALAALGDSEVAPARLITVIRELEARGFASNEFRSDAARCLRDIARRNEGLDQATCDLLESWITDWEPQPLNQTDAVEEGSRDNQQDEEKTEERDESLLWAYGGFEILPHGNYPILDALMLGYLLRKPEGSDGWLAALERRLLREEDPKVWEALAYQLHHLVRADWQRSTAFIGSLFHQYPQLLETSAGVRLIAHIEGWMPVELFNKVVDTWVSGRWKHGPQAAGEIGALRLCRHPDEVAAQERIEGFIAGTGYEPSIVTAIRAGVAHTLVNAWQEPDLRALTTTLLLRLLPIAKGYLADALHAVFARTDPFPPDEHTRRLLEELTKYPVVLVAGDSFHLIGRLKGLLREGWNPQLVHAVANAVVDQAGKNLGDIRTTWAASADDLVEIALTLHRLPETREYGLNLFERLMALEARGVNDSLQTLDRRPFR